MLDERVPVQNVELIKEGTVDGRGGGVPICSANNGTTAGHYTHPATPHPATPSTNSGNGGVATAL